LVSPFYPFLDEFTCYEKFSGAAVGGKSKAAGSDLAIQALRTDDAAKFRKLTGGGYCQEFIVEMIRHRGRVHRFE
jgi:hypothetical protein